MECVGIAVGALALWLLVGAILNDKETRKRYFDQRKH